MILNFPGPSALSVFRAQNLIAELAKIDPDIKSLEGYYVHFVDLDKKLSDAGYSVLKRILDYGTKPSKPPHKAKVFLSIPRPGTRSPWSSKATDIAKRCGLGEVKNIERGIEYFINVGSGSSAHYRGNEKVRSLLHDRMTEIIVAGGGETDLFAESAPARMCTIPLLERGYDALADANSEMGLALSDDEIDYLATSFETFQRDPTDVELMMFAQANSEHCRHKIFNARWRIDGEDQDQTLFGMIRYTAKANGQGILSAYSDNSAVMEGAETQHFLRDPDTAKYAYTTDALHILIKVETHNHPTAISPYSGVATGSGGEIRDQVATGRGAMSKAGLTGFSVSHLKIPNFLQPWEVEYGKPERIASALEIMIHGPLGGAAFNNEFGRPNLAGYFRTFEQAVPDSDGKLYRGFHKPIMIAGGMGNIRSGHVDKQVIAADTPIVVLGGPAMLIGLGGGAASSQASGVGSEALDFASVQRGNPEMQRRCQEVVSRCWALGEKNPIISIHDVGAGGLANAVPEIIQDSARGGCFELRAIPSDDPGMSPLEVWCNESQERFVLAIDPKGLEKFESFCRRERCPYAVLGKSTKDKRLLVHDHYFTNDCIDIPMSLLFGDPPRMIRDVVHSKPLLVPLDLGDIEVEEAVKRVMQFPAVADKSFLITIGDRSVTGLVVRDQMVGPWQVAVADVAVTASGFRNSTGEALALGERPPLALINPPASGRIAIGEALTNLAAASVDSLAKVKLSANWMAATGFDGEDAALFDTVRAVAMELCPALGVSIPVGKDSLSMKSAWREGDKEKTMVGPLSLVATAFAPVTDVTKTLTPQLRVEEGETCLVLIDLGLGKNRLGGSALAQVYNGLGDECPDLDEAELFKAFFETIQHLNRQDLLLAYHDRSDGGLLACTCEMAFAARCGITIVLDGIGNDPLAALFSEELGAVIQIRQRDMDLVTKQFSDARIGHMIHDIGFLDLSGDITFQYRRDALFSSTRAELQQVWSETSYRMQSLRDNPACARQWFDSLLEDDDPGLNAALTYDTYEEKGGPYIKCRRPGVAILREQGVNGHLEMAAAFDQSGFDCIDVHMSDLADGSTSLKDFVGIAACGGFSYGDVLGAGAGWAHSIRFSNRIQDEFAQFFQRADTFGLGVCNGCQMLSHLKDLIAGAEHWPTFVTNASEQFEARLVLIEVQESSSIFFDGMAGSRIPVSVAHGEGRARFDADPHFVVEQGLVALRYVDNRGFTTEKFPSNPNGSPLGITGLTTTDGRFTIMMPHPERCFRTLQNSWHPSDWGDYGPWLRIFENARSWVI